MHARVPDTYMYMYSKKHILYMYMYMYIVSSMMKELRDD